MLPLSLFIAHKYLRTQQKHHAIRFMIRISFAGIAIGTFALMLTLIIMNGFEKTIHDKMQGITAHAVIHAPGKKLDDESIHTYLKKRFSHLIDGLASSSTRQVLIKTKHDHSILFIKGIEPADEAKVSSIGSKVIKPHPTPYFEQFDKMFDHNSLLIGSKLAKKLNAAIGDSIILLVPEPTSKKKITLKKKKAFIAGIFKIGLDEYDNNFAFSRLPFLQELFGEKRGVDQIAIKLKKSSPQGFTRKLWVQIAKFWPYAVDEDEEKIRTINAYLPNMNVSSWKELYPALVSSLKLEKYVMFFILALIVLVASMSMISVLFMQMLSKRKDTAILQAMGMPLATIKRIFTIIGMTITTTATAAGIICAALAGYYLDKYPFIELPDVYYVTHLPVRMDPELFVLVFVCTLLLGFIATRIAIRTNKSRAISHVLRQE